MHVFFVNFEKIEYVTAWKNKILSEQEIFLIRK